MTIGEIRKAIEKYQKNHPLPFGTMVDVTAISSKEGADIISQTIEKISKKVEEDTDLWCICEMAKMYMQGVKPVYSVEHEQVADWLTHYDSICTIIADYKAEIAEAEGESAFTRECIRKRAFAKILKLFGGEEE